MSARTLRPTSDFVRHLRHSVTIALLGGVLLASIGCATPSPEQLKEADFGPFPEAYEETIKIYMGKILKDPSSAEYKFRGFPSKRWFRSGFGGSFRYGWGVCAEINAKNSYGGYVGFQSHHFVIRENQVIDAPGPGIVSDKSCSGGF